MVTKLRFVLPMLVLAGCASVDSTGTNTDDDTAASDAGSSTPVTVTFHDDTALAIKVKNGVTLNMKAELVFRNGELVLHGSTSQDIDFVQGFIPDDAFGTANQLGPRTFEIVFGSASDINTVLVGERFFLELQTRTVSGTHGYAAAFVAAPRLVPTSASTTTRLAFGAAVTPTYVTTSENGLSYRGTLTTTSAPQSIGVTSGGTSPTLIKDAAHAWHFDWTSYADFTSAAESSQPVEAKAKFGATTSTRAAKLEVRLQEVALAAGSTNPNTYWNLPECDETVRACVAAQPEGTTDFGACGTYFQIQLCSY